MNYLGLFSTGTLVLAAMSVASCSGNEPDPVIENEFDRTVRFAARTEYSRVGDITTNTLTQFNVWAFTGTGTKPETFMQNVTVTKTGTNEWSYSPVQYWPANETVDFYAFSPASWVGVASPLAPVTYDSYPGSDDIIYAVSTGLKGVNGTPNAQVVMNFRHALAKVTVKMSSTNTNLIVKVSNVVLVNILQKGNFHFPHTSTLGTPTSGNVGSWTDQNTPMTFIIHMSQSPEQIITLTSTPTEIGNSGNGVGGSKYLIPQLLSYRSNGMGNDNYLTVMCSVYDAKTGTKLWPNANTPAENIVEGSANGDGLLKFPLNSSKFSEWSIGCHYIYNVIINANEDMGTIDFGTPNVDTFIEVNSNYG